MQTRIIITNDHIALARQFHFTGEFDAPMVDQKKPYGTEDVEGDVLRILGHEKQGGVYPQQMRQQARMVHNEMALVMQVWMYIGEIKAGEFKRIDGDDNRRWIEI